METINGAILSYASDYIGQEEIKGNMGFKDPEFDKKMDSVGFKDGYAWCMLFCELCWKEAYQDFSPERIPLLDEEMTAGTVRTFRHFKSLGWTSNEPVVGAIAIWQKYKDGKATSQGHAAIVESWTDTHVITIDGNTNDKGGREGYIVAGDKKRALNFDAKKGLVLLGFIHPR